MIDLKELRTIAEKAGEQHRPNITLPDRPCLVCDIPFPCNKPWDKEPEVPGDVVLALLDRLHEAEALLDEASGFEHADGCSGRYPEYYCKCGRREWGPSYGAYREKYGATA